MNNEQYYDPWAKVGNSATNALSSYLQSRPSQGEVAQVQAELNMKNSQANKNNMEARRTQSQMGAADSIASIFREITGAPMEAPMPSGQFGPGMAVAPDKEMINQRYNENMPDIFSNAMKFAGDKPSSLGDIFMAMAGSGGASPEQITNAQMGSGMKYANTRDGFEADPSNTTATLTPGSRMIDQDYNEVASAPFKPQNGGMGIRVNEDGSVEYSEGGFGNDFGTTANNQLDKQLIGFDGILSSIGQAKQAVDSERSDFWKSTGITGSIGGSTIFGVMQQLPVVSDLFAKANLSNEDMTRIKLHRSLLHGAINEAGRFIMNGANSDRYSNDDRKGAEEALKLLDMGTDDAAAYAILVGLENTIKQRMSGTKDLRNRGSSMAGKQSFDDYDIGGGLSPEKKSRLEELRARKNTGM